MMPRPNPGRAHDDHLLATSIRLAAMRKRFRKWSKPLKATHENIKIEVETIGYDDYFTQMQTRVAGGTAPDCYELNIENFAAYANKGLLAEITGQDLSGLNETALGAFNVNGKQYGLPESFSNVVLIYNKDLFDQAGVTYPTDDWTQDDVQNAAEKIRALATIFSVSGSRSPTTSSSRSLHSTAAAC